jgi:hypothetical protein
VNLPDVVPNIPVVDNQEVFDLPIYDKYEND